jgi:hypothetical protein
VNTSSTAVGAAATIAILVAGAGCARQPSDGVLSDHELEKQLRQTSEQLEARLPMWVDDATRWEGTVPGPGRKWTYVYTLMTASSADVSEQQIQDALGEKIRISVCTSREMQVFVKNKVQVVYHYNGNDGADIGEVAVDTRQCT